MANIRKTFMFEGKRYQVYGSTEDEAFEKMVRKKIELEQGLAVRKTGLTVRAWAEECIDSYKHFKSEEYEYKYRNRMKNCILNVIGDMKLREVKPLDCQRCLNIQADHSEYYIKQTKQMLKFIFDRAVDNDLIAKSPVRNLNPPEGTVTGRRSLTAHEEQIFLSVLRPKYLCFQFMYYCGCRPEESYRVMGKDIKSIGDEHVLHIRGTKTKKSDRQVPIPDILYEKIKDTPENEYICLNEYGSAMDEKCFGRKWNSLKRDMNIAMGCEVYRNKLMPPFPLAKDLVPYCLRHTYCTNLQKQKIDIRVAQKLMGHSDIRLTANIYTHATDEIILEAAKMINGRADSDN